MAARYWSVTPDAHNSLGDSSICVDPAEPLAQYAQAALSENDPHRSEQCDRRVELSVVVPVFNEQDCLPELYGRLTAVMRSVGRSYEIIFVDDGSHDGSLESMRQFHQRDPNTRYISFTRNFGQTAAITAGQIAAQGCAVITIDSDLQNPPEEIPKLLKKFDDGYEVVYGTRKDRQDSWVRRICSRIMIRVLKATMHISLQPDVTAFMVTHRRLIDELNRCPEKTRFHPALCAWLGARTAHVDVCHHPRYAGKSKYGYWKLTKQALDILTSFTLVPLRLASWIGLLFALFGFGLATWALVHKLIFGGTLLGWPSLMAAIGLLGGVQLLTIGMLGEYVGRAYTQVLGRPLFVIRETEGAENERETLRFPRYTAKAAVVKSSGAREITG